MEYYYNKKTKSWQDLNGYIDSKLETEKVNLLRNARRNKKFIIVKNKHPGINTKYVYIDVDDYKLYLNGGKKFYFYVKGPSYVSHMLFSREDIVNLNTLEKLPENPKFARMYVDVNSKSMLKYGRPIEPEDFVKLEEYKKETLKELTDTARLYYEIS